MIPHDDALDLLIGRGIRHAAARRSPDLVAVDQFIDDECEPVDPDTRKELRAAYLSAWPKTPQMEVSPTGMSAVDARAWLHSAYLRFLTDGGDALACMPHADLDHLARAVQGWHAHAVTLGFACDGPSRSWRWVVREAIEAGLLDPDEVDPAFLT